MFRAKLVMLMVSVVLCTAGRPGPVAADDGVLIIYNGCGTLSIDWTNDRCSPPTIVPQGQTVGLQVIRSFRTGIRGNDPVYCLYELYDGKKKWLAAAKYGRSVGYVSKVCKLKGNNCSCIDG